LDIYLKKRRWKVLLLLVAVLIGIISFAYTNWLTKKMAQEERNKVELWAEAERKIIVSQINTDADLLLPFDIVEKNKTIPIIVVNNKDSITFSTNINYAPSRKDIVLRNELHKMKDEHKPIVIDDLGEDKKQFLYYRESYLLRNLKIFPLIQLFVVFIFILVAYLAFSNSRKAEQNQVWVGMAKETAHQLGTPISSLMAWIELLKMQNINPSLIDELEKDTNRLEKITERFSKIGSAPELQHYNLIEVLNSTVAYLKTRSSSKITFENNIPENEHLYASLNAALFSWVIENLCKNAIDAMDNQGKISFSAKTKDKNIILDISDTGKGIPKSMFKTIFQPGFSTKKRGWGLGLSLARRIIENYHKGKIFIKSSELNKGTTFRIILPQNGNKLKTNKNYFLSIV
jgi:signal transduction histidine kinase